MPVWQTSREAVNGPNTLSRYLAVQKRITQLRGGTRPRGGILYPNATRADLLTVISAMEADMFKFRDWTFKHLLSIPTITRNEIMRHLPEWAKLATAIRAKALDEHWKPTSELNVKFWDLSTKVAILASSASITDSWSMAWESIKESASDLVRASTPRWLLPAGVALGAFFVWRMTK